MRSIGSLSWVFWVVIRPFRWRIWRVSRSSSRWAWNSFSSCSASSVISCTLGTAPTFVSYFQAVVGVQDTGRVDVLQAQQGRRHLVIVLATGKGFHLGQVFVLPGLECVGQDDVAGLEVFRDGGGPAHEVLLLGAALTVAGQVHLTDASGQALGEHVNYGSARSLVLDQDHYIRAPYVLGFLVLQHDGIQQGRELHLVPEYVRDEDPAILELDHLHHR